MNDGWVVRRHIVSRSLHSPALNCETIWKSSSCWCVYVREDAAYNYKLQCVEMRAHEKGLLHNNNKAKQQQQQQIKENRN